MNFLFSVCSVLLIAVNGYTATLNSQNYEITDPERSPPNQAINKRSSDGGASALCDDCLDSQKEDQGVSKLEPKDSSASAGDRRLAMILEHNEKLTVEDDGEDLKQTSEKPCAVAAAFIESLLHDQELLKELGLPVKSEDKDKDDSAEITVEEHEEETRKELTYDLGESSDQSAADKSKKPMFPHSSHKKLQPVVSANPDDEHGLEVTELSAQNHDLLLYAASPNVSKHKGPNILSSKKQITSPSTRKYAGKRKVRTKALKPKKSQPVPEIDSTQFPDSTTLTEINLSSTQSLDATETTARPLGTYKNQTNDTNDETEALALIEELAFEDVTEILLDAGLDLPADGKGANTTSLHQNDTAQSTHEVKNATNTHKDNGCVNQLSQKYPLLNLLFNKTYSELAKAMPLVLPIPLQYFQNHDENETSTPFPLTPTVAPNTNLDNKCKQLRLLLSKIIGAITRLEIPLKDLLNSTKRQGTSRKNNRLVKHQRLSKLI